MGLSNQTPHEIIMNVRDAPPLLERLKNSSETKSFKFVQFIMIDSILIDSLKYFRTAL